MLHLGCFHGSIEEGLVELLAEEDVVLDAAGDDEWLLFHIRHRPLHLLEASVEFGFVH